MSVFFSSRRRHTRYEEPEEYRESEQRGGKPKMISVYDAFDVSAPELESSDPKTLNEALALAVTNGWLSNETAAGMAGYDYTSEQKKIAREEKQAQTNMYQGGAPVEGKPLPNQTGDDQNGGQEPGEPAEPE